MDRRAIGSLDVSVVGLGTNNFGARIDAAKARRVLDAAADLGVNFLDTADVYGGGASESIIGDVLGARRADVVIATKFGTVPGGEGGGSAAYVREAVGRSLERLKTDYIDLYILHRPDPATPIAETLGALGELVDAGTVREIGCSNFSPDQLRAAAAVDGPRFVNVQNNYSLVHRDPEAGVLDECVREGITFVPYFPLAAGLLTGKYRKDAAVPEGTRIAKMAEERRATALSEANLDLVERLVAFCESRGHTLLELAFSWLLAQPAVASVIAGATDGAQLAANAAAAGWALGDDDLAEVRSILGR